VVKDTTRQLKRAFAKTCEAEFKRLIVLAQQHYLYLETVEEPPQILPGLIPARFGKKRGVRAQPLGRLVWTGDPAHWQLQLYKWSDECWDEANDAGTIGGTPEDCLNEAIAGW
jgi:hypothetical protein